MIYLVHPDGRIAAVEDARKAGRYEAQGFARCSADEHRAAWRERDRVARLRIAREDAQEAEWRELRRIVGRQRGVVYPVKVSEG